RPRAEDRPRLDPRPQRVRPAHRDERCARLRREGRPLGRGDRGAPRMSEGLAAAFGPPAAGRARDGPLRPLPAWLVLGIGAVALAAPAAGVYSTAVSRHAPSPVGHATLTVVVCLTFVGTGLLALRRPPYVRFGLLLVAAGFASLLGSLHDAN